MQCKHFLFKNKNDNIGTSSSAESLLLQLKHCDLLFILCQKDVFAFSLNTTGSSAGAKTFKKEPMIVPKIKLAKKTKNHIIKISILQL